ncbi:hypothetical protein [Shewanella sp.]|uniref:hypothetical protein n=1 Tax=Shewanella sp. TaxID=50422 RepID=UPI00259061E4|nr:hypothetical protein [Shewanella sp.]MCJ8301554.1 hypothetical protein [Shewanella sp.]
MYFIRRNLLLGLAIVLCYLAVIFYTGKLEDVSLSDEAHVYGTEQAYGRAVVDHRVSLSDIREVAKVQTARPHEIKNTITISRYNEFSSVNNPAMAEVGTNNIGRSVQANLANTNVIKSSANVNTRASVTARLEALRKRHQDPNYKVELEKRRLSSVLNTAIFLLGIAIISLTLSGDNQKREFDEKMIFLSALIFIDFVFIGGQFTMLMPLIGLAVLYGRQYLSTNFTPHQE